MRNLKKRNKKDLKREKCNYIGFEASFRKHIAYKGYALLINMHCACEWNKDVEGVLYADIESIEKPEEVFLHIEELEAKGCLSKYDWYSALDDESMSPSRRL
ncbi:MAG: hypothetical protein FWB72_06860 [Firmicutes bacterium]|nr:hypothetical protein [Bacillota bacterium]